MTYEIEILEPSVQKIIEELANLNLIKFVRRQSGKEAEETTTRAEVLAGWAENVKEVRASIRGEKKLKSAYQLLAELEEEQAL
jgi:hypothetical protein